MSTPEQIAQDQADVAREESELQAAKDKLAADLAAPDQPAPVVDQAPTDAPAAEPAPEVVAPAAVDQPPVDAPPAPVVSDAVDTPASVAETPAESVPVPAVEEPTPTPAAEIDPHVAASIAANQGNAAVAQATMAEAAAVEAPHVSLLQEIEDAARQAGGEIESKLVSLAARLREMFS